MPGKKQSWIPSHTGTSKISLFCKTDMAGELGWKELVLSSSPARGLEGVLSPYPDLTPNKYQAEVLPKGTGWRDAAPFSFQRSGQNELRLDTGTLSHKNHRRPTEWETKRMQSPQSEIHDFLVSVFHAEGSGDATPGPMSCPTWSRGIPRRQQSILTQCNLFLAPRTP